MARPGQTETRWYSGGKATLMAEAEGYVMVRKPYCMPFVVTRKFWNALPSYEDGKRAANEYNAARSRPEDKTEGD